MAITSEMQTQVTQLYVALFARAPESEGLGYWVNQLGGGASLDEVANAMFDSAPSRDTGYDTPSGHVNPLYPRWMTNEQIVDSFYQNVLGRAADAEGRAYWTAKMNEPGVQQGSIILEMIGDVVSYDGSDAAGLYSQGLFVNRVEVAQAWAMRNGSLDGSVEILQAVTDDPATADAAIAGINAADTNGKTFSLGAGQDIVTGTGYNDVFKANVVQNANGAQVNSLGSGDEIDGGAGSDVLNAKITSGVFAGGSASMPIQPELKSVETVNLQAVIADINGAGNNDVVYFNAKDVVGTTKIASNHSDASLVIQNMTSQGLNHVSQMTVGMEYTGNADHMWKESDLSVYFDQDYLTTQRLVGRPSVDIQVMNEDGYDQTDGAEPLAGVFFRELTFTLNGVRYDLTDYLNEDPSGAGTEITTYAEALAAISDALAALKADNPSNAALQTVQAELGPKFLSDFNPVTLIQREGTAIRLSVEGLTDGADNELSISQTDLELARAASATVENNNRYERADNEPPTEDSNLSINIDLEKVGLAGDGGTLIVGSMNKTADNEWGAVPTVTKTVSGFQQFDVHVHGTNDKSSSLAGLHSTNNNLRTVVIDSEGGSEKGGWADLYIGNSNTAGYSWIDDVVPDRWVKGTDATINQETWTFVEGSSHTHWYSIGDVPSLISANALRDVQTLDASAFKGDLSVYAALTSEVGPKYLNRGDAAPAHASADNVAFAYTGGVGDDYFNVAVSAANYEGTGPATREDWNLTLDGGAGNDELVVGLAGGEDFVDYYDDTGLAWAADDDAPWYLNQEMLGTRMTNITEDHWWAGGNIAVNGGTGDDVIRTMGSGDYTINGGTGNDAIYVDNTGYKSVWALNYADGDLSNLVSDTNETYLVWNTKIRVSFHGFEATVDLAASNGRADDLAVNQAVKKAINSDAVLSKLLVAQDGPANSLIVNALIDGDYEGDGFMHEDLHGLSVQMIVPTAAQLSLGDVTALNTAWGTAYNEAGAAAALAATAAAFGDHSPGSTYEIGLLDDGSWSWHTQDSIITGGSGNDVIVLGTGEDSNDTVVYSGFDNGTDTIVHFETGSSQQVAVDVTPVTTGRKEVVVVTFNDLTVTDPDATVAFDAQTIQLNNAAGGLIPGRDLALAFKEQYVSGAGDWTVTYVPGSNQVTLTANLAGEISPNLNAGDFVLGPNPPVAGTIGVVTTTEGIDAYVPADPGAKETFTVQFNDPGSLPETALTADHAITFDGASNVNLKAGDGAQTVAGKVAAGNYANWTAELQADHTSVKFTAKTVGNLTDVIPTDFDHGSDGIYATVAVTDGAAATPQQGAIWYETTYDSFNHYSARDYLDFSAYKAVQVQIDQAGAADVEYGQVLVAGDKYITMVESATNAGEYTTTLWLDNGAAPDTNLGTIGVLDFGDTTDFQAWNFILGGSVVDVLGAV